MTSGTMAAMLFWFHRNRNYVLSIEQDNRFVYGLGRVALVLLEQERKRYMLNVLCEAAFHSGLIQQCKIEINNLITNAETLEAKKDILPRVKELENKMEISANRLIKIEEGIDA